MIEQIMKWRLKKWVVDGRQEWVILPIQPVIDCLNQTKYEIEKEFDKHKYIHKNGKNRWDFYRQIAEIYFDN